MVFLWSLSDCKSPQVSRTLLSILAVFNNAVVSMASTRPPTSKSSSPFNNLLVTVPKAPITIGIIVIFIFHSFFNWNFQFFNLIFFFSFFVYRKVSEFIKFRVFFKVLFRRILGWIFFHLNFLGRTSIVDFHLFLLLFLKELHSRSEWRNQSAGIFFLLLQFGPRLRTESSICSSWLKGVSHFLVLPCLGLLLPFPLRPNQVPHVVSLIFFLRYEFYTSSKSTTLQP